MQKVLVQGKNLSEVRDIKSYLEAKLPYEIGLSMSDKDTLNIVQSRPLNLIITCLDEFNLDSAQLLKDIRAEGFQQGLLVVSSQIDPILMQACMKVDRVHFAEKPLELKNLKGLVVKLIKTRQLPQQQFKRFRTNQKLAVESYSTGEVVESSMFNLSVGGAYFESQNKCHASVGDLIKMSVSLKDVHTSHMMNARVIWTTRKGHYSGGYGVGVKFVKNEDVYRQLLGD
ncbi:MAG: PilZ domain-containing protein [Pseudomonadota bacterium]